MTAVLAFGTAQLSMSFDAQNKEGSNCKEEAVTLLRAAEEAGIRYFDTAESYGEAEECIAAAKLGAESILVTKLSPLAKTREEAEASVEVSLKALDMPKLGILLLHRWSQWRQAPVREGLRAMVKAGKVKAIGASVQSRQEAEEALAQEDIRFIQLPCNLLDWRWEGFSGKEDVHIQICSALLQGILAGEAESWPKISGVNAPSLIATLERQTQELERKSRVDLCYAYLRGLPWAHSIAVGIETKEQLLENVALFKNEPLTTAERGYVRSGLPRVPETLLNPARWEAREKSASGKVINS